MANSIKVLHDNFTEICLLDEAKCFYLPIERANLVSTFIRGHYTADDETAIINNHLADATEEHEANWTKYQQYRTDVKAAIAEIWADIEEENKKWEESQPEPIDPPVAEEESETKTSKK